MGLPTAADRPGLTHVRLPGQTHIPAGVVALVGEEQRPGVVLLVGAADLIGLGARGCGGRTTAPFLRVSHSARLLPLPPSATFHRVRIPACAGIGPTPTATPATGTIAEFWSPAECAQCSTSRVHRRGNHDAHRS